MSSDTPRKPGHRAGSSGATPLGDLEDAYLRRAISELSDLQTELARASGPGGDEAPAVHPSGSPQAEIMMVKWSANLAERQEGVAFFGRSGTAILKSVQRLGIDPLQLYGTLVAKRPDWRLDDGLPWLEREIVIVRPKLLIPMGDGALDALNRLAFPLSEPLEPTLGTLQRFTPTIEAIVVPDIDESLDEQSAKRGFWAAFRAIGEWHAAQPPY
ncbi:MAG: uracil-DNA glycosylase [Actinobacteria bacterium]|nr:uracil-DNA glycosylase [Actinomycetota bacterium]